MRCFCFYDPNTGEKKSLCSYCHTNSVRWKIHEQNYQKLIAMPTEIRTTKKFLFRPRRDPATKKLRIGPVTVVGKTRVRLATMFIVDYVREWFVAEIRPGWN